MSAYAYGKLQSPDLQVFKDDDPTKKMIAAIAALVPADILAVHAIVIGWATETADDGTTTITRPDILEPAFWGLLILSGLLFVVAKGFSGWKGTDVVRLLLPAAAFAGWTTLFKPSALTPLVAQFDPLIVSLVGLLAGVLLIAIAARVTPK